MVDAAAVLVNASTGFNEGLGLVLGAEQRLTKENPHASGTSATPAPVPSRATRRGGRRDAQGSPRRPVAAWRLGAAGRELAARAGLRGARPGARRTRQSASRHHTPRSVAPQAQRRSGGA